MASPSKKLSEALRRFACFPCNGRSRLYLAKLRGRSPYHLAEIPRSAYEFRRVRLFLERRWKVRGKFVESTAKTAMEKSKNKYEYAEYDVIRVIIVIIAGTARLAEQRSVTAPRRGTRRTETAAPRPVSCTRACGGDQRRARGGSRGRVGRVAPSN